MRRFDNVVQIDEMLGRWYLAATTHGNFDARPRVEDAILEFTRDRNAIRFEVLYRTRRRTWRIRGKVPERVRESGLYNWSGSGGWLLASRLAWSLARSEDGTVVAAHNQGSMMTNEGLLFLAREGLPTQSAEAIIAREAASLGLSRTELRDLSWRIGSRKVEAPLPNRTFWPRPATERRHHAEPVRRGAGLS